MTATVRFSQLSIPRQALVRLCQSTNHGHIHDLAVLDREPLLTGPAPTVMVDIRLDLEERPRDELAAADFELRAEVGRLMSLLDRIRHGKISSIEVRGGIPRRVLFEKTLTEDSERTER
jgi:hypothetical protein